jgi:hypothetical protein
MKRMVILTVVAVVLAAMSGVALAWMGGPARGMGARMMGPMMGAGPMAGQMGRGPMMGAGGPANCPGMAAATGTTEAVTEERAKVLAQEYADQYLKGFTVDKVLPFATGHGTAYSIELTAPSGETRVLHVNPFGRVMPFGGPGRRAAG